MIRIRLWKREETFFSFSQGSKFQTSSQPVTRTPPCVAFNLAHETDLVNIKTEKITSFSLCRFRKRNKGRGIKIAAAFVELETDVRLFRYGFSRSETELLTEPSGGPRKGNFGEHVDSAVGFIQTDVEGAVFIQFDPAASAVFASTAA